MEVKPDAGFSKHGWERVSERTCISFEELAYLIRLGKTICLGRSYGHYTHHLFWSRNDREAFVAVEEDHNKIVVTILPLHYHRAWAISPDAIEKARELATGQMRVKSA